MGLFNIGSSQVFSKEEIIVKFAEELGFPIKKKVISAKSLIVDRCLNCGLNTKKVENFLNIKMPTMQKVVKKILSCSH